MSGPAIVVMGVSGTGKSTVGQPLAEALGARFIEGDDHHPPANRKAMEEGIPLNDAMRAPWLDSIAADMAEGPGMVVATCSALKRTYRDRLREGVGRPVLFVLLDGARGLLAQRMSGRSHFFPASLLDSQIATLEPPDVDEMAVRIDVKNPPEVVMREALAFARAQGVSVPGG